MRYIIDIESPDFKALLTAVTSAQIHTQVAHNTAAREMGRGSLRAIQFGQRLEALKRVQQALEAAQRTASALRPPPMNNDEPRNLQVIDDMPLVYGRPRPVSNSARGQRR